MKKITVILPIYEVKGRTSKCLDSILKQKMLKFFVFVMMIW